MLNKFLMKKNKSIYLYEIIAFIVYIFLKLIIAKYIPFIHPYFDAIYFTIIAVILLLLYGFYRDKHFLKKITIRYIVIALLGCVFIVYFLGLFTGFSYTIFSHDILSVLKNIMPIIIFVISKELIRYVICHKFSDKPVVRYLLTAIFILIIIFNSAVGSTFSTFEQVFIFTSLIVLPTISKECLYTYIANHISLIPNVICEIFLNCIIYILPIYPNIGDYLTSMLGILLPALVYLKIRDLRKYDDLSELKGREKTSRKYILIPIVIVFSILIILVSGIFHYQLIAIGSDSMNPIYYKGDAIIYEKIDDLNKLEKDDILVFKSNGVVVTHRIYRIIYQNDQIYYQTKGDNNEDVDITLVGQDDVLGRVKYIIKYIGYPTVWLNENLMRR